MGIPDGRGPRMSLYEEEELEDSVGLAQVPTGIPELALATNANMSAPTEVFSI